MLFGNAMLASTGTTVSERISEPSNANIIVSAIGRKSFPSMPSSVRMGRKTIMMMPTPNATGRATSREALTRVFSRS